MKIYQRMGAGLVAVIAMVASPSFAQDTQAEAVEAGSGLDEFTDAFKGGTFHFNWRLRLETVNQDGTGDAEAVTSRVRFGYTTAPCYNFTFHIDVEDIRAFDDDRYNAAGLNSNGGKAVVADPEDTELNQLWIRYQWEDLKTDIKFGRQRVNLDDQRFVGAVGWRQNEQTFDAATLIMNPVDDVTFVYGYVWDINRIFGPDSGRDYDSDSHLINVAWDGMPMGKLVGFAYLLDVEDGGAPMGELGSSDTYGLRYECGMTLDDQFGLSGVLSWATQEEAGDNPTDYDADYFLIEGSLKVTDLATFGAGYEVLESDNSVASFQTPLATGHKFNGWADMFLGTPAEGLEDLYLFCRGTLPGDLSAGVYFHFFDAEDTSDEFGEEIDLILSKKLDANWSVLAKFAEFNGKSGFDDTTKFWLQTEFSF